MLFIADFVVVGTDVVYTLSKDCGKNVASVADAVAWL